MKTPCHKIEYTYRWETDDTKGSKIVNLNGDVSIDSSGQTFLKCLTIGYSFEYDLASQWHAKVNALEQILGVSKSGIPVSEAANSEMDLRIDDCCIWTERRECCNCGWQIVSFYVAYKMSKNDAAGYLAKSFLCKRKINLMHAFRDMYNGYTRVKRDDGIEISSKAIIDLLIGRKITALTGAGISAKSGIPCFDKEFMSSFSLYEMDFPDNLLKRILFMPLPIISNVLDFQAQMATSRPNAGHRVLTQLQEIGVLDNIITSNIDMLHQEAGSKKVIEVGKIGDYDRNFRDTVIGPQAIQKSTALLVLGVSSDEYGIIEYARGQGLIIAAVCKEKPNYLSGHDYYVQAKCEDFLPEFANRLLSS